MFVDVVHSHGNVNHVLYQLLNSAFIILGGYSWFKDHRYKEQNNNLQSGSSSSCHLGNTATQATENL